tara:strand:+ start:215 stop:493 length:279 start_codon:yes stop_codon:yes gene_type:complete
MAKYFARQDYTVATLLAQDVGTITYQTSGSLTQLGQRIARVHHLPSSDKKILRNEIFVFKGVKDAKCIGIYRMDTTKGQSNGKLTLVSKITV